MIFKKAIKEFLSRELEDWSFVKKIPKDVLKQEILEIVPKMVWKTEPRQAQLACNYISIYNDCFNYWLQMGLGKTKASLDVVRIKQLMNGDVGRILVVCLGEVSSETWRGQINEHSDYTCQGIFGSKEERSEIVKSSNADILIINYEGLFSLLAKKGTKKKTRSKTQQVPDEKLIRAFAKEFNAIILDEVPIKTSNHQSLTFRILKMLCKDIKYRFGLTGTPFSKNPMKLWSSYYLIDRGETLGETLGLFQQSFFTSRAGYFGGVEYTFKKNLEKKLNKVLKNKSIRYTLSEVKDVPKVSKIFKPIIFPAENAVYYKGALDGFVEEMKNKEGYSSIENSFVQLRQIVGGFLGFKNDEGDKLEIRFDNNPRLEMLFEILEGIPEDEKVIVFNEYTLSGDFIEERLKKQKIGYCRLYGKTKNKTKALRDFIDKKSKRVFLVQSASGGTGLNLQVAKYGIFYENPVSVTTREQAEARFTGARQIHEHAFIFDIMMLNSVDEDILQFHKDGKEIFQSIIDRNI